MSRPRNWLILLERQDELAREALAEVERIVDDLDRCYADALDGEPLCVDDLADAEDPSDYTGMGWVGKDGLP